MASPLIADATAARGEDAQSPRSSAVTARWRIARRPSALLRRTSARREGDREAVLRALVATDEELIAVAERRLFLKKIVACLAGVFLITEIAFACVAWQGLMLVQEDKYQPNYMQWKVFFGFFYYCIWTYAVKSCADICMSDCAELFSCMAVMSGRSILASVVTSFLGYVPGMWCCSLFLAWDSLPKERNNHDFAQKVSLAGYLHVLVLLIAWAVLAVRVHDRAAVNAIRIRLQETLTAAHSLLNGCEEAVHHMRKVPFDATELTDPDDGETKECPICACEFDSMLPIVGTRCNHLFHEECLAKWCKTHHVCPLCRDDLREAAEPSALDV